MDWICVSPKVPNHWNQKKGPIELKIIYPQDKFNLKEIINLDFKYFFLQPKDDSLMKLNLNKTIDYCRLNKKWRPSFQFHTAIIGKMIIFKNIILMQRTICPNSRKNHKYNKVHGHSYEIIIKLKGELDPKNNWVMDLEKLDSYVKPVLSKLDHSILNEVKGLEKPTSENIAKWLWQKLKKKFTILKVLKSIDQELEDVSSQVIESPS